MTLTLIKPLGAAINLEDRPVGGFRETAGLATSAFTGDVQAGHEIGDGFSLRYSAPSDPRPVIAVDALYNGAAVTNGFEVQSSFNGIAQPTEWYATTMAGTTVRFAVQVDAPALLTRRYPWQMKVVLHNSDGDGSYSD